MELILWLITNRFLLNLLIRSMEQFWRWGPEEKSISRKALIGGIIWAILLGWYPRFLAYFDIEILQYSLIQSPSSIAVATIILLLCIYIAISSRQPLLQRILCTLLVVCLSIFGTIALGLSSAVIYFLLAASTEEFLKSASLKPIYPQLLSDLILFGICAGLGFARFENIIYLIGWVIQWGATEWLIAGRYFSAVPLHAVWTGLIGLFYSMLYKNRNPRVILGIIAIILCHAGYNYLLYLQTPLLTIVFIIAAYGGLAWLLLKVERLYMKDGGRG